MSSFNESLHTVMFAMRLVNREAEMRELWGDGFNPLVNYLALACAPTSVGLEILCESIVRRPVCKTMVLTGQRCSGAVIEHGTDSLILLGVWSVMKLLAPVSCLRSEERTGREPIALSLIFSGGVTLTPEMGELPGDVMAEQFNGMTKYTYADVVGADSFSMNTGDQGRVLAGILFARRIERVVFVHVIDHIARFAATVIAALQQLVDAENSRLKALAANYPKILVWPGDTNQEMRDRIASAARTMPEILFVALGDWSDGDPRRGRDDGGRGILRAREAFGPMQTPEEAMYPDKRLGCEYADRYFAEQDPIKSIRYACPALAPWRMISMCPEWVKRKIGYAGTG